MIGHYTIGAGTFAKANLYIIGLLNRKINMKNFFCLISLKEMDSKIKNDMSTRAQRGDRGTRGALAGSTQKKSNNNNNIT